MSVITAVRNGAATIAETIASVQAQTDPDWEHVVVDDGSTDATAAVVEASGDTRLRYLRQSPAGRSVARNHGIDQARGEFLLFLDADDWLPPTALRDHLAQLNAHPELGASLGDGWFCHADGAPIVRFSARRGPLATGDLFAALVANPGLVGSLHAVMLRAAPLRAHGVRFDPALYIGEDARFFIELARHVHFGVLDAVTCRYRWHVGGTTLSASPDVRRAEVWRALRSVPELPEFARLPAAARAPFYSMVLTQLLGDAPDEQLRVAASAGFAALPAPVRTRLLRVAASEHLLGGRPGAAAHLLDRAAQLHRDPPLAVLRTLLAIHPGLARVAVRMRRAGRRAAPDPLWAFAAAAPGERT